MKQGLKFPFSLHKITQSCWTNYSIYLALVVYKITQSFSLSVHKITQAISLWVHQSLNLAAPVSSIYLCIYLVTFIHLFIYSDMSIYISISIPTIFLPYLSLSWLSNRFTTQTKQSIENMFIEYSSSSNKRS